MIDSADPHGLADWWAEALGWQVEPQDGAFIRRMVESGAASEEDTTTHRGALVWRLGAALRSPDEGRPREEKPSVLAAFQLEEDARYLGTDRRSRHDRRMILAERTVAHRTLARHLRASEARQNTVPSGYAIVAHVNGPGASR